MSPAQFALLNLVASEGRALNIYDCVAILGKRQNAVSTVRNYCLMKGWLEPWVDYHDPIRISDAGRAKLREPRR